MEKISVLVMVLFLSMATGYSRFLMNNSNSSDSEVVSQSPYISLTTTITCEPEYGFLPCSANIWGDLFLVLVYQYLIYLGEGYISQGSDLFFSILGPGIFGASAFQILGSLPHAILVLASGLSGTEETAQSSVSSGVSIIAGSTVFLLTILWGTCVLLGRVDLSASLPSYNIKASNPLTGSGITTDPETRYTARIMVLTIIPFIIAQLPRTIFSSYTGSAASLIALALSLVFIVVYCFYQVFQPWIQNRRHEFLRHKLVKDVLLQKLLTSDGKPNITVIEELFRKNDVNNDKFITTGEIKGIVLGIQFQEVGLRDDDDFVEKVLQEFNVPADAQINEEQFVSGISKWISDKKASNDKTVRLKCQMSKTELEQPLLITAQESTAVTDSQVYSFWSYLQAWFLLVIGIFIISILASPLIETTASFSTNANVPSIYVFFILVPLSVNYRAALAAIEAVQQKTQMSASLTLSEIYTGALMNNVVGVATFLGIVYLRGLVWDFSAEVLVVVIVTLVMGLYSSYCNIFPIWTSVVAYVLYPVAVVLLVCVNTYGWL